MIGALGGARPRVALVRCGFASPADRRLGAMIAFADVNQPMYGRGSRGAIETRLPGANA